MRKSRLISLLISLCTALATISGAVAVPLLFRGFYYMHIGPLRLVERFGLSEDHIREAYNDVMDFCLGARADFSAGVLSFSQSGASHFDDVRGLFIFNLWTLCISAAALIAILLYCRHQKTGPYRFCGHGPGFWSSCGIGAVFLVIGGLAAVDFDRAFTLFHTLFFPGKDNWVLDKLTDPIIKFLPQVFFRNCGILIVCIILTVCVVLIVCDIRQNRKQSAAVCNAARRTEKAG